MTFRRQWNDVDEMWTVLKDRLVKLFTKDVNLENNYMEANSVIYEYLVQSDSTHLRDARSRILYDKMEMFFLEWVESIAASSRGLEGELLLEFFDKEWFKFGKMGRGMNSLFRYLVKGWINREIEEKQNHNLMDLTTMALTSWMVLLFRPIQHYLIEAVMDLINKERQGEKINTEYISSVIKSLQYCASVNKKMAPDHFYKELFETKLLEITRQFYADEAMRFIESGGRAIDYVNRVEKQINQEMIRVEQYLLPTTHVPLKKICEEVLVSQHIELFNTAFEESLSSHCDEVAAKAYKLCCRVGSTIITEMKAYFEKHVAKDWSEKLERVDQNAFNDPTLYFFTLWRVHQRHERMASVLLANDPDFMRIQVQAATIFINTNAVTSLAQKWRGTKSAELLALICDRFLRNTPKIAEFKNFDDFTRKFVTVFRFLDDKFVFNKIYTMLFIKRMIHDALASDSQAELNLMSNLRPFVEFESWNHFSTVLRDCQTSKELNVNFKMQMESSGQQTINFNAQVLKAGVSPQIQPRNLILPVELSELAKSFESFYNQKYNGRRLAWNHSQCCGEVVCNTFTKRVMMTLTTSQMCVILLFNDTDALSVDQIMEATGMDRETTLAVVTVFVKNRILTTNPNLCDKRFPVSGQIMINFGYTSRTTNVDLSKVIMKLEEARDTEAIVQKIDDDRKQVINATIMHIMKTQKQISHQQLVMEVISLLSKSFQPKIDMIKDCIGFLIDHAYIDQNNMQKDVYEYIV
ncbi:unnamed protein product [Caenorhabditis sp. 36 PRJEB53466]|nr:unnamed protein product [Caenorhabditis sp. 36 PRJEB53466]